MYEFERMMSEGRVAEIKAAIAAEPELARSSDEFGQTLLILAAGYGLRELVKELIALGANPSHLDGLGLTPLHAALWAKMDQKGDAAAVIRDLLNSGADPNRIGFSSLSALHLAVSRGMLQEVKLLLDHGADPNLPTDERDPETPLGLAARNGDDALLELLRKYGATY